MWRHCGVICTKGQQYMYLVQWFSTLLYVWFSDVSSLYIMTEKYQFSWHHTTVIMLSCGVLYFWWRKFLSQTVLPSLVPLFFSNNNIIAQDLLYSRLLLYVCAGMYIAKQWNHLNLCWFLVIREEAKETFLQQHLSNTVRWLEERKTRHEVRLPNITLLVTYMYIEWCSVRESMFVQENHEVSSAIVSTLNS